MNREWMTAALCRGMNPDWWFPTGTGRLGIMQAESAAAVCRKCPVIVQCKQYRDATCSAFGVWGGDKKADRYLGTPRPLLEPEHGSEAMYARHLRRSETPCVACREGAAQRRSARRLA